MWNLILKYIDMSEWGMRKIIKGWEKGLDEIKEWEKGLDEIKGWEKGLDEIKEWEKGRKAEKVIWMK